MNFHIIYATNNLELNIGDVMMELERYVWDENYSIGFKLVDEQHQRFFEILNRFQDAYTDRQGANIVSEILDEVIEYTKYHFATEEKLFNEYNYTDAIAHTHIHNEFIEKILSIRQSYKGNKKILSIEALMMLRDWLLYHILNTDKKFGQFVKR